MNWKMVDLLIRKIHRNSAVVVTSLMAIHGQNGITTATTTEIQRVFVGVFFKLKLLNRLDQQDMKIDQIPGTFQRIYHWEKWFMIIPRTTKLNATNLKKHTHIHTCTNTLKINKMWVCIVIEIENETRD